MSLHIPKSIPLGSYESDGIRVGPSYNGFTTTLINGLPAKLAVYYDKFGKGVLNTPFNTWPITPYASSNICPAQTVPQGKWLQLVGSGVGTSAVSMLPINDTIFPIAHPASNTPAAPTNNYIQFDWPRVPEVVLTGAGMTGPTQITFFGSDWYGFPLQSTYTVQAAGSYPKDITASFGLKAFYTITGVFVRGVTAPGATLAINTSNIFGLPYVLDSWADVITYSWNGNNLKSPAGTATLVNGVANIQTPAYLAANTIISRNNLGSAPAGPFGVPSVVNYTNTTTSTFGTINVRSINTTGATVATDQSVISWLSPEGGASLVRLADPTTPINNPYTSDVRGLISLPQTGETWGPTPNGAIPCLFTAYIKGAYQWINQLAAGKQPQGAGTVPPLTKDDLYGVDQYYTGVAA